MSPFGLFRKKKPEQEQQEQVQEEKPLVKEQSAPETTTEVAPPETPPASPQTLATPEKTVEEVKTYLRAMPLRELSDLETVMNEVKKGNIIILRITPLASKSLPDVKQAVDQLYAFAASVNGDIARLGEERVVVCPEKVRIWREKTPVQNEPIPTAA